MEQRGYKNHFCSNQCSRLFNKNIVTNVLPRLRREEWDKNPKKCGHCSNIIPYDKRLENKYCSRSCAGFGMQKNGGNHKWSDLEKEELRTRSLNNPYFNGTISTKNGIDVECPTCKNKFYKSKSSSRICCSRKCYLKWVGESGYMKGKTGGYRRKGGRGKQGWYKGYYCNSSWELAWVIYQLDHGVKFDRNTEGFEYEFNGKKFKFFPDFKLSSYEYVEVKGYTDDKVKAKFQYFPHHLQVIGKQEIKPFIEYSKVKHGPHFIELYEN